MKSKQSDINIAKKYEEILPQLNSYLYRMICDNEVVKDLSHDTFLKVIEKKSQFNEQSSLKTWIFSIATNLAIDWLRKRKRWPETAQDSAKSLSLSEPTYREKYLEIHSNSSQGAFEFKEHISFCFTCISKTLVIEEQVALILKDIYDFKVREIADILESPYGTVKHRLFVARKKMNEIFDRRCALINKKGVCHQCSELNGLFNSKQKPPKNLFPESEKQNFYDLRANLVKAINPVTSHGSELEDCIMQVLRQAINDK